MKTLLVAFAVIGFCTIGVSSLKCYICNSVEDGKACGHGSDADSKFIRDCNTTEGAFRKQLPALPTNQTYTLCRKMVTNVNFDVNTNEAGERIKRTCGWDDESEPKYNTECYYRGGLGGRIRVCSCQTDECNGTTTLSVSSILSLIGMLSVFKTFWV